MTIISTLAQAAAALILVLLATSSWSFMKRWKSGTLPPPGPPGLPILGNIFDVPSKDSHLVYTELAKQYGPIFQVKLLQMNVVVISDLNVAVDLLDKRGVIYSDRPKYYMSELSGWGWDAANMAHGDRWRARRRLVHQEFYANAMSKHYGLIHRTTIEFVRNLLETPDEFLHHIQRSAAANIMGAAYGICVAEDNDPYIEIGRQASTSIGEMLIPSNNLVDALPFLRFIPPWVPVLGHWTRFARDARRYPAAMREVAYARTKADMKAGVARPCMLTENIEALQPDSEVTEEVVKDACAVSFLGGADTTVCSLVSFVMAMVLWPECQKKAQDELDRVLGDRLADFSDRDALPYVEAIIRETYRRFPVTPLALPHAVEEDDIYRGFMIQKGSTVIANTWAMMLDERTYPNARLFNPDRWMRGGKLDDTAQDPRVATFGFGRRICPGRHFADAAVFLTISTALKCFSFTPHVENGVEVPPSGQMEETCILSCPVPFKCKITPRYAGVQDLVEMASDALAE